MGGPLPIDPLEVAAEQAAWIDFVSTIEATIPFPDSTSADTDIAFIPPVAYRPGPVAPDYVPSAYQTLQFKAVWEDALGDTAVDPATGITVPLDIEGGSISPAFYDSETHTWSVNPAYTAWAVGKLLAPPQPPLNSIPAPDPPEVFTGPGPAATWGDVYDWWRGRTITDNAPIVGAPTIDGNTLQRALDAAVGNSIKALGGLITQVAQSVAWLARATQARIDAVQLALFKVASDLSTRLGRVERVQWMILRLAIPSLQKQIIQEKHNRQVDVVRHDNETRDWVRNDVYAPLNHDIQANQITATNQVNQLRSDVPGIVEGLMPAALAGVTATLAAHALKLKTLEDLAESCTKPMCETMGPNTDLGKFLKALKIAEWIALLAEIAALRADGLDGVLTDVEHWAQTAIGTFESLFLEGGKTLGETVLGIG